MSRFIQIVACLALAVVAAGCASTNGYLIDRGRDAADIVTFGIGFGLGAKARLGPIQSGLLLDVPASGLRGGVSCGNSSSGSGGPIGAGLPSLPNSIDIMLLVVGAEHFQGNELTKLRNKDFSATMPPFLDRSFRVPASWYTEVEAVVALGLSVRVGINPGELLDFILGWTTLDIFKDDIAGRK